MKSALKAYRLWSVLGYLLLVTVIILSLVHIEQPLDVEHADKYEHFLAYGCLMYWWGMVQPARRLFWIVALSLMGLSLEWLQSLTPHRHMQWSDALANVLGVAGAAFILATPASRLLAMIDGKVADRLNARRP